MNSDWIINPLIESFVLWLACGIFALVVLAFIAVVLLARRPVTPPPREVSIDLTSQIAQIERASAHHADVSAVVSMVREIEKLDEDAVALLQNYPKAIQAAAWLHLINLLGADLQVAQQELSNANRSKGGFSRANGFYGDINAARRGCQQHVDNLRAKLDAASKQSGQAGGLRAL